MSNNKNNSAGDSSSKQPTVFVEVDPTVDDEDAAVISGPTISSASAEDSPTQIPPEPVDKCNEEVEEDDEYEYEYEEDEDAPFSGFLVNDSSNMFTHTESSKAADNTTDAAPEGKTPATIRDDEESSSTAAPKQKWRQPSQEAVSMSMRAEQETTGGKRRLAQDLYRIMNQDTSEAGFSLHPTAEDSMKHWTIELFQFDPDSNLAKDMKVLGIDHIELEMTFPDQYPFEPPFVRVVKPRFKRQTGFVMSGALCMELLTKDGWNPVNDIESVIVSIRSLLVVGDGRLEAAYNLSDTRYQELLAAATEVKPASKRPRTESSKNAGGAYTTAEAEAAYTHLSDYHKKKGWDSSGWWARKG
ncbi:ubiquitin-conjugating enzyme E2 Q [Fistulifera solaris]|uniref:Ubiquitin-conjugating enzyme E2 Q n=1 Tax=Fistulifera solaris TaxID=1519565 RepID=A0A1Z5K8B1_FISSO|nr:ubiquitin-conjugating enzyme E2 Q [Fistulifera solaris]|eukprot:GAX22198.1 ubiquitin-conjugating enzyme E2 Q [Fistulifera solaris]